MRQNPTRDELQQEALTRAATGHSLANWPTIIEGFIAKGIAETDIRPRENVFTYHAWRALGRQVRRGEHGVKVCTWITTKDKAEEAQTPDEAKQAKRGSKRPWTATVFHFSQTDPIA